MAGLGLHGWTCGRHAALARDPHPRVHFTRDLQVGHDHQVVSDGPYQRLRHPSYTGAILVFTGIGVGLGNALSLVACALLPAIGYVRRIPTEEELLRREIGDPYIEYSRHTNRLIPGIW